MGTAAALEELRSTIMVNGEPFVMIPGISVMLKWCAGSWGVEVRSGVAPLGRNYLRTRNCRTNQIVKAGFIR